MQPILLNLSISVLTMCTKQCHISYAADTKKCLTKFLEKNTWQILIDIWCNNDRKMHPMPLVWFLWIIRCIQGIIRAT